MFQLIPLSEVSTSVEFVTATKRGDADAPPSIISNTEALDGVPLIVAAVHVVPFVLLYSISATPIPIAPAIKAGSFNIYNTYPGNYLSE